MTGDVRPLLITTNAEALRRLFALLNATPNIRPRYNAAPTDERPVVRLDRSGNRELAMRAYRAGGLVCDAAGGLRVLGAERLEETVNATAALYD
jgi:hypothetical protein